MNNAENDYVETYVELVDVIGKLQNALASLPNADSDHVDSDDVEFIGCVLSSTEDALRLTNNYIAWQNRPSVYDQSQAILREAESRGFGK